jgi:hypothetical protein
MLFGTKEESISEFVLSGAYMYIVQCPADLFQWPYGVTSFQSSWTVSKSLLPFAICSIESIGY